MSSLYHSISPIGLIALGLLVVQNSTAVLITRYSKTRQHTDHSIIPFNSSSVVVSTEVSKLISSLVLVFIFDTGRVTSSSSTSTNIIQSSKGISALVSPSDAEEGAGGGVGGGHGHGEKKMLFGGTIVNMSLQERLTQFKAIIQAENFDNLSSTMKLAIPAALYTIQNNALYIALNNLDATVFQVGSQSKILTTAVMSVLLLNRSLSVKKWIALFVLAFGIVMTQLPSSSPSTTTSTSTLSPSAKPLYTTTTT
eukprot:Rmarinus@m.26612